jgi:Halocarboxylic acid dehydrogenase DehI
MYLLHIKPVPPEKAEGKVEQVYQDITQTLNIVAVPLVFQYIAVYEQYLFYIWDRIKRNLESDSFKESCAELKEVTYQTVPMLPTPSGNLKNFVGTLHPSEKYELTEVVNLLDDINIKLMLITIGIRESLKGIPHIARLLEVEEALIEEQLGTLMQRERLELQGMNKHEITQVTRMLAPLLGNNTLLISHYPEFFANVAAEMEILKNMPAYLHLRVEMEHLTFQRIDFFETPLDCSYVDFMRMTEGVPYTDEIIFLLKDTFPSHFPHLVLTTAVMKNALAPKSSALVS